MPQERNNPYPMPTPEEMAEWATETDPATAAARYVVIRRIEGLFRRPYLRGDCDHAPVLKGVRDLTEACVALLDALETQEAFHDPDMRTSVEVDSAASALRTILNYKARS